MLFSEERLDAMTFANEEERFEALSGADRVISLSAKDQYFRELDWREPISNEECEKLLQRVVRGNVERRQPCPNQWVLSLARNARERLVAVYQPLVVAMARRRLFRFQSMDLMDVIQEGNLGLLDALDRYDDVKSEKVEFRVFAMSWIKREIVRAVNQSDAFIRLSWDTHDTMTRKNIVESQLRKQFGRQPLLSEIAEAMEVAEETLQNVLTLAQRREVGSLHGMMERYEIAEDSMSFVGLYQSAVVSEDARQQELAATFERVFTVAMPEKQRDVLELRYGFGDVPSTMRSPELVREMMGLNANQDVTGSEKKAKQRLRGMLEPVSLPDGRLSCQFHDVYSDEYCTTRGAAELLGLATSRVDSLVQMGRLIPEMRSRPHIPGPKVRFFKKADVLALKEGVDAAPVKLSSRWKKSSLEQARRSALLPSIVA